MCVLLCCVVSYALHDTFGQFKCDHISGLFQAEYQFQNSNVGGEIAWFYFSTPVQKNEKLLAKKKSYQSKLITYCMIEYFQNIYSFLN